MEVWSNVISSPTETTSKQATGGVGRRRFVVQLRSNADLMMEMSSVHLRKFVNERLTAAAEEIFGVFEKTLSVYKEEIVRHRRLLDTVLNPEIKLERIGYPQTPICREGAILDSEQGDPESSTSLDHEDLEPLHIKEEEEELLTSQEGQHFATEQETKAKLSPTCDENNLREHQTLLVNPDQSWSEAENKGQSNIPEEWMQRKRCLATEQEENCGQHVGAGGAVCSICGKSFKAGKQFNAHVRMHTAKKPYSCKYCGKEFAFNSAVLRHLRVHTGEKPFECNLCGKRFNASTTLRVHHRIHTGEKPYKCKTCERAFTTSSNLKKHVVSHSKVGNRRRTEPDFLKNVTENHGEIV